MDESVSSTTTDNSSNSKETTGTITNGCCNDQDIAIPDKRNCMASAIACNLTDLISENELNSKISYSKRDIFYLNEPPDITIEEYINHLLQYSQMSFSALIISIIYIDRMCEKQHYLLSRNNIHRLILASSILSIKFNDDQNYDNAYYAQIGGVSATVLNQIEYEFYVLMDFRLWVEKIYYQKYLKYFKTFTKLSQLIV